MKETACLLVPVSVGELLDKITILDIKSKKVVDPEKRDLVIAELSKLEGVAGRVLGRELRNKAAQKLVAKLREVNERIWWTEDEVRSCEREASFGPGFVELARDVYRLNDTRSGIKRDLNKLLNSDIVEVKQYEGYD